jgi:NAD(P)-dependent dehydrogenase (short-subunit alcohol dehydrogenase family)
LPISTGLRQKPWSPISSRLGGAVAIGADVRVDAEAMVAQASSVYGVIDILVNNAGIFLSC